MIACNSLNLAQLNSNQHHEAVQSLILFDTNPLYNSRHGR